MLINQLKKMQELLEVKKNNRTQQRAVQGLDKFGEKTDELLTNLKDFSDYYTASNANIALQGSVRELINRIGNAKLNLSEGQETFRDNLQINEILTFIRTYLVNQWQADVKRFQEDEVLDKIRLAMFLAPTARNEIGRKQQQFSKLLEKELPNHDEMSRIENLVEDLERLATDSLPPMSSDVQQFLEKLVVSRKARLSDMNEEIWQWCEAHKFLDKIELKLGESNDF